jgi:hypothetical protein
MRTNNAQHLGHGSAFMGRILDTDHMELKAQAKRRRDAGLCMLCGRPAHVSTVEPAGCHALCSCGARDFAAKGTRQFKALVARASSSP